MIKILKPRDGGKSADATTMMIFPPISKGRVIKALRKMQKTKLYSGEIGQYDGVIYYRRTRSKPK